MVIKTEQRYAFLSISIQPKLFFIIRTYHYSCSRVLRTSIQVQKSENSPLGLRRRPSPHEVEGLQLAFAHSAHETFYRVA